MEPVLHATQSLDVVLGEVGDRDPGHERQDLADQSLVHFGNDVEVAGLPLTLTLGLLGEQVLLHVTQGGGLLEVLRVDRGLLLLASLGDAIVELAQVRRGGHTTDA